MHKLAKFAALILLFTACETYNSINSTTSEILNVTYEYPYYSGNKERVSFDYLVIEFQYNEHDMWMFKRKDNDREFLIHSPECKKCNSTKVEEPVLDNSSENSYWGWQ